MPLMYVSRRASTNLFMEDIVLVHDVWHVLSISHPVAAWQCLEPNYQHSKFSLQIFFQWLDHRREQAFFLRISICDDLYEDTPVRVDPVGEEVPKVVLFSIASELDIG